MCSCAVVISKKAADPYTLSVLFNKLARSSRFHYSMMPYDSWKERATLYVLRSVPQNDGSELMFYLHDVLIFSLSSNRPLPLKWFQMTMIIPPRGIERITPHTPKIEPKNNIKTRIKAG